MIKNRVENCTLSIVSCVDGVSSKTETKGFLDFEGKLLSYTDAEGTTEISFNNEITVERKGNYGLFLLLRQGETTTGKLSIGSNVGELPILTQNCRYELSQKCLKFWMNYDIDMSGTVQNMRLYLVAKIK